MGHVEDGVALLVEVALVESVMLVFQDVVHRDDGFCNVVAVSDFEVADIILGLFRVGVGLNLETVQGEAERQGVFRYLAAFFLNEEMAVGAVGLEFHPSVLPREHGEQGTK